MILKKHKCDILEVPSSSIKDSSSSEDNNTTPRAADVYPLPHLTHTHLVCFPITLLFVKLPCHSITPGSEDHIDPRKKCFNLLYPQILSSARWNLEVVIGFCLNLQLCAVMFFFFSETTALFHSTL